MAPFENLSGDPSLDWVGAVLARVIADQLTASVDVRPVFLESNRAMRALNIHRSVQGYFTGGGEQLRATAVLRDFQTQKNLRWLEATNSVRDPAALAETIAKGLDSRTRPFGTQNAAALRSWGESMGAADAPARAELLERAIVSDPNFGAAYADLIQSRMVAGDRDRALEAAKRADERLNNFTDLDRARVELIQAGLRGDQEQRRKALVAYARLVSTDLDALRNLGDLEVNARRFDAAVEAYRNAVALDPENPALLNQLGYAEVYNNNLNAARDALERYRTVDPDGLNPLDSLGEVHFIAGRFAEAEKYFLEAARKQPGPQTAVEYLKAAQARYLTGDTPGADQLYGQYEEALKAAKNPTMDLRRAQWLYVTGRQQQAAALMQAAAQHSNPELGAYARVQSAVWILDAGERARAAELAADALGSSRNPGVQRIAALVRAAAQGGQAPADLEPLARGLAALSSRDFSNAATLLKAVYERTPPAADGHVRTLYAWALAESGRQNDARPLLAQFYIPLGSSSDPILDTQAFPHFLRLRSALGLK